MRSGKAPTRPTRTVVLVGGGHAHVQVLRRWAMDPPEAARLLVVLDRPEAVYSGMVPGFVAGEYAYADLEIDVVPLARRAGAGVVLSPAIDLDPVRHEIAIEGRPPLRFDLASVDVGSTVRGLELPGVREHALATRPIADFVQALDARIDALRGRTRTPRIVLVGGGAAGVELAFTLEHRLRSAGLRPSLQVLTSAPDVLPGAASSARRVLEKEAAARRIEFVPHQRVQRVDATGVYCAASTSTPPSTSTSTEDAPGVPAAETCREADLIVWATGAAPLAFPEGKGVARLATSDDGFLAVRDTLQAEGFDDVFAVGDCARLTNHPWIPRAGVYAVRQGPVLDHNLRALLRDRPLRPYRPQRDFLSLLNLGGERALGTKWGRSRVGRGVYRLKDRIDRRFMDRFQMLDATGAPRPANEALGAMGGSEEEEEMACGGCAAKLGAEPLAAALADLPRSPPDETVLLGLDARDDVAATLGSDGSIFLHNIDVIRAFADDPWLLGRVATANALSDLHAKGGQPRHAQAVLGLPEDPPEVAREVLFQALSGVRSVLDVEGVSLLGGHTTLGDALTVGLAVTGAGPAAEDLLRQAGARPGDRLLLTQPIGTGVVLAADMQGLARGRWVLAAYAAMQHTNGRAGQLAIEVGAHAATDVTGFGLAGHLSTLLEAEGVGAEIDRNALPLLPGAADLWARGLRSTAHPANRDAFLSRVVGATEQDEAWLFDPQTAGGLLFAVSPDRVEAAQTAFAAAEEPPLFEIGRIVAAASDAVGRLEILPR